MVMVDKYLYDTHTTSVFSGLVGACEYMKMSVGACEYMVMFGSTYTVDFECV